MLLYYHEEEGIANIYNKTIGYIIFLDGRIPTEYSPEAYYLAPTCSNPIFCDVIIIICVLRISQLKFPKAALSPAASHVLHANTSFSTSAV
jgi:hypothetical protein